jgi:epoxyqueuosine reductase
MSIDKKEFESALEKISSSHGIIFFGVSSLDISSDFKRYQKWLLEGRNAGMEYLEKNLEIRENPQLLLPNAQSALVFGLNYNLGDRWQRGAYLKTPRFAMYSRLSDYHKTLKAKLSLIQSDLQALFSELKNEDFRQIVDSAPMLERAVASKTRSGFIGKNTCFIHPKQGSFFLLCELLTTYKFDFLEPTTSSSKASPRTSAGGCGTCKRCQVHCPTGALDSDYQIDARKCLSWWTIENRGPIPREYWSWIGSYVFGCDICQLVCPWNRNLEPLSANSHLIKLNSSIDMFDVATMDQTFYEKTFGGTPATRAKREGLIRNAIIAMHVKKDIRLLSAIKQLENETHLGIRKTIETIFIELDKS